MTPVYKKDQHSKVQRERKGKERLTRWHSSTRCLLEARVGSKLGVLLQIGFRHCRSNLLYCSQKVAQDKGRLVEWR